MSSQSHNQDVFIPPPTCSASWFCPRRCQALKKFMLICNQYCISFLCRCLHQIISNGCMNILIFNLMRETKKLQFMSLVLDVLRHKLSSSFSYTDFFPQFGSTKNIKHIFPLFGWWSFPLISQEMKIGNDSPQRTHHVLSVHWRSRTLIS